MRDVRAGFLDQASNVAADILKCQLGNLSLTPEMNRHILTPIFASDVRKIAFITQKVINNQDTRALDLLLDRLVPAELLLIEWKGKWLSDVWWRCGFERNLLQVLLHEYLAK